MDASVSAVDGFAFSDQLLRFGFTKATRVGEASGNFFVAIESCEIGFVGNGGDEHLAAFFGRANAPDLHPRALVGEEPEISVDVFGVIENLGRSHDVMKGDIWRGNAGAERQMVDEIGAEKGFGSELLNLLGVLRVVAKGTRDGL